MAQENQVFAGPNSIKAFLDPENISIPPLVALPQSLNPFSNDQVDIFASLAYANPLQNIKLLPAWTMMLAAKKRGDLDNTHTVVASSSGNFVASLASIVHQFGVKHVKAIVPKDLAPGKKEALLLCGADVESVSSGAIARAKEYEGKPGFLHLNQYSDVNNPAATQAYYAPTIWWQTSGKITIWCSGLGTGGTTIGMSKFLKSQKNVTIIGVNLLPGNAVPGVRTLERLKEVSLPWQEHIDHRKEVGARESYKRSLDLQRQAGIYAGPSSGFSLAGLLQFLSQMKDEDKLDDFRNREGKVLAVFCCPDTFFPYMEKYGTILDASDL